MIVSVDDALSYLGKKISLCSSPQRIAYLDKIKYYSLEFFKKYTDIDTVDMYRSDSDFDGMCVDAGGNEYINFPYTFDVTKYDIEDCARFLLYSNANDLSIYKYAREDKLFLMQYVIPTIFIKDTFIEFLTSVKSKRRNEINKLLQNNSVELRISFGIGFDNFDYYISGIHKHCTDADDTMYIYEYSVIATIYAKYKMGDKIFSMIGLRDGKTILSSYCIIDDNLKCIYFWASHTDDGFGTYSIAKWLEYFHKDGLYKGYEFITALCLDITNKQCAYSDFTDSYKLKFSNGTSNCQVLNCCLFDHGKYDLYPVYTLSNGWILKKEINNEYN